MNDRDSGQDRKWEEAWQGIEPEQPRPRRTGYWLALAAAIFLMLGACALGYFVLQQRAPAEPALVFPGTDVPHDEEEAGRPATETVPEQTPGSTIAPTVTLPGSFVTPELPPPATDVIAPRAAAPPGVDLDPSQWPTPYVYSSPHIVFTADSWDGSDDLAASWFLSWDDANLYLAANVTDDIHVQEQVGNQTFRGDSVELQVDTDRSGDYGPQLSPDDFQINLSPGNFAGIPPSAFRFQGTAAGEMRDAVTPHSITVAARPTGAGYLLTAAIPWRDLNITPAPGLVIGLAVNINDNDRPGTAVQEMMKSNAPGRRFADPTTWGTLTLQ